MGIQSLLDKTPLLLLLLVTIVLLIISIEFGFQLARFHGGKTNKAQIAQVRAIMAASLGLLAFMLAFSFNMAQGHFEKRIDAYLLEVNAIDATYRGSSFLDGPRQQEAKILLREFVSLRREAKAASDARDSKTVMEKIRLAEQVHNQLWRISESLKDDGQLADSGIFVNAVLAMINASDQRVQAKLFNRISPIIWITLYLMALMSMFIMGFQAGLTEARSRYATWTLAVTFASVMMLVTDLDRPSMSLFKMNQQLMVELHDRMASG